MPTVRDDHLLLFTKLGFAPLIPLTAIFGVLLLVWPAGTDSYWSWVITPDMSAAVVGAGYTFGALAITTMIVLGKWRSAIVPVIATWTFSCLILAATLMHQDRFFTDSYRYYIWLVIYAFLPVFLPIAWWLNYGRDPGRHPDDTVISPGVGVLGLVVGTLFVALALLMFASPSTASRFWPWELTPLMSRVIGAWIIFLGTAGLIVFFERRWVAIRPYTLLGAVWFAVLLVASLANLNEFDGSQPATWVWFVMLGLLTVGPPLFYVRMERPRTTGT